MDKIKINRLIGANIYADGNSLLGKSGVTTLPDITYTTSEHNALGLIGVPQFFSGVEAVQAQISWLSYYDDVMKKVANPFSPISIQVRGSVANYTSSGLTQQVPCVFFLKGTPSNFPLGTINPRENPEIQSTFNCTYVRVEWNGRTIFELDILSNILKIDGVDILAEYNKNIGLM